MTEHLHSFHRKKKKVVKRKKTKHRRVRIYSIIIIVFFAFTSALILDYLAWRTEKKSYFFSYLLKKEFSKDQHKVSKIPPPSFKRKRTIPSREKRIKPKIAIIIDDIGNNLKVVRELISLQIPITISILPSLPYSQEAAKTAYSNGLEVMLHLPLEPINSYNFSFEKGEITRKMTVPEIERILEEDIKSVPHIKGVNNHMGSRITREPKIMEVILKNLKKKNLFFIDSLTSNRSIAFKLAQELGLKAGIRDIFLDRAEIHQQLGLKDVKYTEKMIKELLKLSLKKGKAIGIGHPFPQTLQGLRKSLSFIENSGVDLVYASQIVTDH